MGNKVNPIGMRLQVNRTWDSRWFANTKDFGDLLLEDLKIREFVGKECKQAGIARVIIERPATICTAIAAFRNHNNCLLLRDRSTVNRRVKI